MHGGLLVPCRPPAVRLLLAWRRLASPMHGSPACPQRLQAMPRRWPARCERAAGARCARPVACTASSHTHCQTPGNYGVSRSAGHGLGLAARAGAHHVRPVRGHLAEHAAAAAGQQVVDAQRAAGAGGRQHEQARLRADRERAHAARVGRRVQRLQQFQRLQRVDVRAALQHDHQPAPTRVCFRGTDAVLG